MKTFTGIAIAIAWPEFLGKQPGTWYDTPMRWLGENKNFHYKVGHAALALVNTNTGKCYYFDCGRYHAPFQYGRIRDASTDHNLTIHTKAITDGDTIENISDVLNEVQMNKSCLGMGPLYASYCKVNFECAWAFIKQLQGNGIVHFGPFVTDGTNCCRFVRSVILAGIPTLKYKLKLNYLWLLKPMPITIVNYLSHKIIIPEIKNIYDIDAQYEVHIKHHSTFVYNRYNVKGTLPAPEKPTHIAHECQWLSGEVAGSWFLLQHNDEMYTITRYSAKGKEECTGEFKLNNQSEFDSKKEYSFTHLSHCNKVCILQNGNLFEFDRVGQEIDYFYS